MTSANITFLFVKKLREIYSTPVL